MSRHQRLRGIVSFVLTVLVASSAIAQDEGPIPKDVQLKGKVGPRTVSIGDPELSPRNLDLSRLELEDEVEREFLDQVRRRLDEEELETLRQQRIERMQRKIGTTLAEASLIREDFFAERKRERRVKQARQPEEEGGSDWIAIGLAILFSGYVFMELRK